MKVIKAELSKVLISTLVPAALSFFIFCIVTMYQSYQHMESFSKDVMDKEDRKIEQMALIQQFAEDTSSIVQRSAKRIQGLEKLTLYKKKTTLNEQERNHWYHLSTLLRLEANKDLSTLSRYSEDTFPKSAPIKNSLDSLLASEIKLWESVNTYVGSKSAGYKDNMSEEEGFQSFTPALLAHMKSLGFLRASYLQAADRVIIEKKEAQSRYKKNLDELAQTMKNFKLAFTGATAITLMILIGIARHVYAQLRKKIAEIVEGKYRL